MSKEKLAKLNKYLENIKQCLTSPTPKKHEGHPDSYKAFLTKELEDTSRKIESMKLGGVSSH